MRVKAIAPGHFGQYRQVGDEFEVPAKGPTSTSKWFVPVKAAKPAAEDAKPEGDSNEETLV